jgi:hypothetical protein
MPNSRRLREERAERQRLRLIALLELIADVDHQEQCPDCGRFFKGLTQHRASCDGLGD